MKRIILLLVMCFCAIIMNAQSIGGEITREIEKVKKTYYKRSTKNRTKGNIKDYSGEECFDKGMDALMNQSDGNKSFEWFTKGALKSDGPCELMCGMFFEGGRYVSQDMYKAVYYYRKAANKGIVRAQAHLGRCYFNGTGVERDCKTALFWTEEAAKKGDSDAQADLGLYYSARDSEIHNSYLSAYYYELSANSGNSRGQLGLGFRYLYGDGKEQNINMAFNLFEKAAGQGEGEAMFCLGTLYTTGQYGIQPNREKALYWLQKASDAGSAEAKAFLPIVQEKLH